MLGATRLNPIVAVMVYDAVTVACRSTTVLLHTGGAVRSAPTHPPTPGALFFLCCGI
jgi:hypothetical protein